MIVYSKLQYRQDDPASLCFAVGVLHFTTGNGLVFSHAETERWTKSTKTSGVMGVFRSLSFISAVTGLHWEYAKTPPDTSLARSSLLPNGSRQLIWYIWCNLFICTPWIRADSCRVNHTMKLSIRFLASMWTHCCDILIISLALRAAPKIATVAMLWRFVQAFPNQMMETTTDRNFLAWKR